MGKNIFYSFDGVVLNVTPELKKIYGLKNPLLPTQTIPTGFDFIDDNVGGVKKGGVNIITCPTKEEKGAFVSMMVLNFLKKEENKVFFLNDETPIKYTSRLFTGKFEEAKGNMVDTKTESGFALLWFAYNSSSYNSQDNRKISSFLDMAREYVTKKKINIVVLDSLGQLSADNEKDRREEYKQIAEQLKDFCTETEATVILAISCKEGSQALSVNDIDGSSEITDIADTIFALHRTTDTPAYDDNGSTSEAIGGAANVMSILKPYKKNEIQKGEPLDFSYYKRYYSDMLKSEDTRPQIFNLFVKHRG